ncbi:HNH endonuclease [Patescibacteria group bacterium]
MKKSKRGPIQIWGEKVNWKKRVKAVCKPCWEMRYCPYGPLVEDFPLELKPSEKSCRIFGHDCPVFYVAEPLTETKELRNISRKIKRATQFRVLKRDNQICSDCGQSVKDQDIEFDHIIPWAKGGPSDEHNIMLLCKTCNRKKGKKFEDKYLVASFSEHMIEPAPFEILFFITECIKLKHKIFDNENRELIPLDVCKSFGRRKVRRSDEAAVEMVKDITNFFRLKKQNVVKTKHFRALKHRWGFVDGKFYKLGDTARKFDLKIGSLLQAEADLLNHLSWPIKFTKAVKKRWLRI